LKIDGDDFTTVDFANSDETKSFWRMGVAVEIHLINSNPNSRIISAKRKRHQYLENEPYTGASSSNRLYKSDQQ